MTYHRSLNKMVVVVLLLVVIVVLLLLLLMSDNLQCSKDRNKDHKGKFQAPRKISGFYMILGL